MATVPKWKLLENALAKLFHTRRRPLSGGNQGEGCRDDIIHPHLFGECKHGGYKSLWNLYKDAKQKASKEGKTPVIALGAHNEGGFLLVVHSKDFEKVALEHLYPGENNG